MADPADFVGHALWVSWLDESQFIRLDPHTVAALRRADMNAEACA